MKARVTSIVSTEVAAKVRNVTHRAGERVAPIIDGKDYGAKLCQLVIFLVSVDVDPIENERCCVANSRIGRYKDLQSGGFVRFVSFAVPISPTVVNESATPKLLCLFERLLLEAVSSPSFVVPAGFDYAKLYRDLHEGLTTP